jgi:hypothetical protein
MSTILGYNGAEAASFSFVAGRKISNKVTLASSGVLTELHARASGQVSPPQRIIIHVYADNAGAPGARVAYTSPLTIATGDFVLRSQTGFSVPLAAGDYWIGVTSEIEASSMGAVGTTGGILRAILSGAAFDPPSDPWGTSNFSGTHRLCVWGVVEDVPAAPVAAFSGTPLTGDAPLNVAFTDESTGTPTSWAWDFGDTNTSTDQHPEHEYAAPGTYTVELEVTNAGGSDDEIKVGYITVTGAEPGIEGFSVAFDDPTLEPDPTWTRLA